MASGDTLCKWFTGHSEVPASGGCGIGNRNGHDVMEFDDTTQEWVYFRDILPEHYDGGGVTVEIWFAMKTATSGNVRGQTKFERLAPNDQDIDADGFASANSLGDTAVPSTSGVLKIVTIAHTAGAQMDSIVAGDMFRIGVSLYSGSTSNATGDRQILGVRLYET